MAESPTTPPSDSALGAAEEAVKACRAYALGHPSRRALWMDARDEAYDVLMASGYPAEVERLRADGERERVARRVVDEALQNVLEALADARLLAEKWRRSSSHDERIMGADLLQVLDSDAR